MAIRYRKYYNYQFSSGIQALILDMINVMRNKFLRILFGKHSKRIVFYPSFPNWSSDLYQTLFTCRHRITSHPNGKIDYLVNWEDATYRRMDETLQKLTEDHYVLNIGCSDISKRNVERIFQEVFGYSSFIDPLTYQGKIIEKNDLNSKHSQIRVLLAPVKQIKEGFVYQRYLCNIQENFFIDYRTPCIDGEIPMVLVRFKPLDNHIMATVKYKMLPPSEVYTIEEISMIRDFCRKVKLEYGELDIIRDPEDKRIYIIDANTTPHKPQAALSFASRVYKKKIVRKLLLQLLDAKSINFKNKEKDKKIYHQGA
jgi:hypothetical protein